MSRPLTPVLLLLVCLPVRLPAAAPWPAAPAPIEALVAEAFRSNLGLAGEAIETEQAAARLEQARSFYQPRLDLFARYSVADGGRTLDFPVGDLLNGAYATLNRFLATQGQPARFPSVSNQAIPLLREHEQETKLRLTQPLYRPEIVRGERAARAGVAARGAQFAAFQRRLRAAVHEAYFQLQQAAAAVEIHRAALTLVEESLRVNRSLAAHGRATDDLVLRAQAEVAAVQQQLQDAAKTRDLARSRLNFLLNRPLATPIAPLDEAEAERYAASLIHAPAGPLDTAGREELAARQSAVAAARAATSAVQARSLPALALAVEGGTQGERYRTGPGHNYAIGSLVLEWNLFDGRQRRSETTQARLEERQAARQLEETRQLLALELQEAQDEFAVARSGLAAAGLRREAARAAYHLIARRESEGLANQVTVLDARTTLTSAELNYAVTRARVCIAAARLDRAAALTPLP